MQTINQVFLHMKEEIESISNREVKIILDEVKEMEDAAFKQVEEETKRDAALQIKHELNEISANASIEISKANAESTKKLIETRDNYVNVIFEEVNKELLKFIDSDEYESFLIAKYKKASNYDINEANIYMNNKDSKYFEKLISQSQANVNLVIDDAIMGGFIIENQDKKIFIDESFNTIIKNQREWFYKNSGLVIK